MGFEAGVLHSGRFISGMGYSRKNPHLPDGWQTGNPGGRGGREGLEIQVGGGMQARKFVFRGQFRGICKMKVEG